MVLKAPPRINKIAAILLAISGAVMFAGLLGAVFTNGTRCPLIEAVNVGCKSGALQTISTGAFFAGLVSTVITTLVIVASRGD